VVRLRVRANQAGRVPVLRGVRSRGTGTAKGQGEAMIYAEAMHDRRVAEMDRASHAGPAEAAAEQEQRILALIEHYERVGARVDGRTLTQRGRTSTVSYRCQCGQIIAGRDQLAKHLSEHGIKRTRNGVDYQLKVGHTVLWGVKVERITV
jgi:hypothetical protein